MGVEYGCLLLLSMRSNAMGLQPPHSHTVSCQSRGHISKSPGTFETSFPFRVLPVAVFSVALKLRSDLFGAFLYGLVVPIESGEWGELCCAGMHRHAWMLCRCRVGQVDDVVVVVFHYLLWMQSPLSVYE